MHEGFSPSPSPNGMQYSVSQSPPQGRSVRWSDEEGFRSSSPRGSVSGSGSPRPLAREEILRMVYDHEDSQIRPQVERSCQRVQRIITDGAQQGTRHFEILVCRRAHTEGPDSWHRRQVLLWDALVDLGLESFELRTKIVDGRYNFFFWQVFFFTFFFFDRQMVELIVSY